MPEAGIFVCPDGHGGVSPKSVSGGKKEQQCMTHTIKDCVTATAYAVPPSRASELDSACSLLAIPFNRS